MNPIHRFPVAALAVSLILGSCGENQNQNTVKIAEPSEGTFGYDAQFVKKHLPRTVELSDPTGQMKILVSPDYQGRVFTSSLQGDTGRSFGWINYKLIEEGVKRKQFNPVGGEERFWLGPEGGQFSLYFKKGDSFNIAHWQVPPVLDTMPFEIQAQDPGSITFHKEAALTNYSGTQFNLSITRQVRVLSASEISAALHIGDQQGIRSVGFESVNQIQNKGGQVWKKEDGLLSIWLLGMLQPSDRTRVIIPFSPGPNSKSAITDDYFGKVPAERLQVLDSAVIYSCDGKQRGKIGLAPRICKSIAGSFDYEHNVLSIISFSLDPQGHYVNSKWEIQKSPYSGDAVNSYNDGPLADGSQMGPFYEIESSSACQELAPEAIQQHKQVTVHFQGDYSKLRDLALQLLGVDLDKIKK